MLLFRQIWRNKLFIILMIFTVTCTEAVMRESSNTCDGITAVILEVLRITILGAGVLRLEHGPILNIVFHDLHSLT